MRSTRQFRDISIFGKDLPDVKNGIVEWDIDVVERDVAVHMDVVIRKIQINFEDNHELHISDDYDITVEHRGTSEDTFRYGLYVEDIIIEFDEDELTSATVVFGKQQY